MRLLTAAAVLLVCSSAHASIIYDFSGSITRLDTNLDARDGITLGSDFAGWLEYDSAYPKTIGNGAIVDYSFAMGGHTYFSRIPPFVSSGFVDEVPQSDAPDLLYAEVLYWAFSGLPEGPGGNLDTFDSATLFLQVWSLGDTGRIIGAHDAYGEISSWQKRAAVPEPSTLGLLAIGLGLIASSLRRKKTG